MTWKLRTQATRPRQNCRLLVPDRGNRLQRQSRPTRILIPPLSVCTGQYPWPAFSTSSLNRSMALCRAPSRRARGQTTLHLSIFPLRLRRSGLVGHNLEEVDCRRVIDRTYPRSYSSRDEKVCTKAGIARPLRRTGDGS